MAGARWLTKLSNELLKEDEAEVLACDVAAAAAGVDVCVPLAEPPANTDTELVP